MPKYVIEREIAGTGQPTPDQLQGIAQKSRGVFKQPRLKIQWPADAVWAAFQAGPNSGFPDSAEEFFDRGSLTIQRGGVQFLVNAWGTLMRNTPGMNDGAAYNLSNGLYNELFSDQSDGVHAGRRLFNTYYAVRAGGYWGQIGNGPGGSTTTLSRFEEGGRYVLMRGAHLETQYLFNHPITGWTRNVAYVRPQFFVVYDRTSINNADTDNWMAWHVASVPVRQAGSSPGTHQFDVVEPRGASGRKLFRGRVTTVLPAGHAVNTVDVFNRRKVYRLEIRPGSAVAAATWLTVFDASAAAASAGTVAPLTAAAGSVLAGGVEGGLISGVPGSNVAVLFSKSGSTVQDAVRVVVPASDTYCLVTDLAPNTGYAVTAAVMNGHLTLQITAGGAFTTTAQGTLPINVSATGSVVTP